MTFLNENEMRYSVDLIRENLNRLRTPELKKSLWRHIFEDVPRNFCLFDYQKEFFTKETVMLIDLSLKNTRLYEGCEIEEVAGRLNLKTPVKDAVSIVGRNIARIVEEWEGEINVVKRDWTEITLTGPMAVWAYLIVFHAVVHRFNRVYYDDGRSGSVLVAAHG